MNALASVLEQLQRYDEAVLLHLEIIEGQRAVEGAEHPHTLGHQTDLASLYMSIGRLDDAEELLRSTLPVKKRALGVEHRFTRICWTKLIEVCARQGRGAEAVSLAREHADACRDALGREHGATLQAKVDLAERVAVLGRPGFSSPELLEAERLFREVLEVRRSVGAAEAETLRLECRLARTLGAMGRLDEAEWLLTASLERHRAALGEDHWRTRLCMATLLDAYLARHRDLEAEPVLEEYLAREERLEGVASQEAVWARRELGNLLMRQGRPLEARPLIEQNLAIQRHAADEAEADATLLNNLAWALLTIEPEELRDPPAALAYARRANDRTDHANPVCALAARAGCAGPPRLRGTARPLRGGPERHGAKRTTQLSSPDAPTCCSYVHGPHASMTATISSALTTPLPSRSPPWAEPSVPQSRMTFTRSSASTSASPLVSSAQPTTRKAVCQSTISVVADSVSISMR
jgi:tetratricopeptide (TPR) repeat protein